ncbi:fumarylacetoacetate hydrolase family protein [Miniphocaeibacter halophilus]|uniref:Fumarylacetoacetate hydrolase family protein n=1 Tax=Miniphocaeibacter halophilus TaxID=2931922 RepID=A0AC61MQX5_9FIRM|nr:fumarylacetoacetate hydrolase family protein [Miniphocaeibacter halophilus]QQK07975.1 fumarylacetoacetate hydrolase family protein [Miniphocaeibacter halophilus]
MKIYRYNYENKTEIGIEDNNKIIKLNGYNNIVEMIENGYNNSKKIEDLISEEFREFDSINILSPIERPIHDIICVGKNYADHISELGGEITSEFIPNYFGKRANRILGHDDTIKGIFDIDNEMDYEVELAVIISKDCKNIKKEDYRNYVFGFSIFNDISSRYLQGYHKQWYRGKSVDNYSVLGPCIVTIDEFEFPLSLNLETFVNGELRQSSNTNKMIFKIEDIIEDLSRTMTLEPGDIIATGTPSGVGKAYNPPKYLVANDTVELRIEKIGILKNKIQ